MASKRPELPAVLDRLSCDELHLRTAASSRQPICDFGGSGVEHIVDRLRSDAAFRADANRAGGSLIEDPFMEKLVEASAILWIG